MQVTDIIHNMCVVDTDTVYYQSQNPDLCLETAKRDKKKNYLNTCLNKSRHSTPFVISVDGLLGVEAEETLKHIASCLAIKWNDLYSRICRYIKSRVAITHIRPSTAASGGTGFRPTK